MDIVDQIKKTGMPPGLMEAALQERVPEAFAERLEKTKGFVATNNDITVFLIVGNDSPAKDQFCAALMKWLMVTRNKTGRWLMMSKTIDEELGNAGITCIPAFDLLPPINLKQVVSIIREKLSLGRYFIICATSKESVIKAFGEEFASFVSHIAVSVKVDVEKQDITVIE